ncbi:MAG: chromosome segregation ATPase [Akkermansiaceae bacterium]|jgi:chromosome segregation ATPase
MADNPCFPLAMKFLALAAVPLLLISCKPKEPVVDAPQEETLEQKQSRSVNRALLLNQKRELQKKLAKLTTAKKLDPSGELQIILHEKQQANDDLLKIRSNHPSLQKLNTELAFWSSNARSARASKQDFEIDQASKKTLEITTKIHDLTRQLPAIREAEDRIARSNKQIEKLQRSIAEKSPEGRELLEKIKSLENQINSL